MTVALRQNERKHYRVGESSSSRVTDVGRKVDLDLLVGADGLVDRLGLKRVERLHELRRRNPDFPPPVLQLKRAMIWYWPDVERWARKHGRLPTRPSQPGN